MEVVQLTSRHFEERKCAAWFEVDADDRGLLGSIDHKEARARAAEQRPCEPRVFVQIFVIVNSRLVLLEVDDQLNRAVWHEAFFAVWAWGVAVVEPEEIHKPVERRQRNVTKRLHATQRL